jgi:hypothetical protein
MALEIDYTNPLRGLSNFINCYPELASDKSLYLLGYNDLPNIKKRK